jgi:hypothetical protein
MITGIFARAKNVKAIDDREGSPSGSIISFRKSGGGSVS